MRAAILVLAAGMLAGCAATRGSAPAGGQAARPVRLDVPFFPDDTNQCGPSALDFEGRAEEATPAGDRAVHEQLRATRDSIQSAAKLRDHAPGQEPRKPR